MTKVKAYAAKAPKQALEPFMIDRREPGEHDVAIDIKYCGICHSDIHQARDEWNNAIAGIVTSVGSKVKNFKVGDHVGVGCMVDSCRKCTYCEKGLEQYCTPGFSGTYNGREQDGKTPTYGGYSQKIVVDENYALKIPKNLPLDKVAPLMCAGITLFSPLMHWKAGPGKKVAIVGLGGLGHMGVKIAHALGADVSVLSHSDKKREDALRFGADHFYDTSKSDTFTKLNNYFDLIINTVSADIDWNQYLGLVKPEGTMVLIGVSPKPNMLSPFSLIRGRKELAGSLIGGIKETQEMLDFCGKHNLTPEIEMISIDKVNEAYDRVVKSDVRYRFVIDIASLN
jgi:uncharacterized zinc-type alcohol dehydrogenase-like protein